MSGTPAPTLDLRTFPLAYEADQVYASVSALLGERLSALPTDAKAAASGVIPVMISRPDRYGEEWFSLTPKRVLDILAECTQWMVNAAKLRGRDFNSERARWLFARSAWFLDQYWPHLRRGIYQVINQHNWPSKLNEMMAMFPAGRRDSKYVALGVATIDLVRNAIFGGMKSPCFIFPKPDESTRPPEPKDDDQIGEMILRSWDQRQAMRERKWWATVSRRIGTMAPAAVKRFEQLGAVDEDTIVEWVRGLEAEVQTIHCQMPERRGGIASEIIVDDGGLGVTRKRKKSQIKGKNSTRLISELIPYRNANSELTLAQAERAIGCSKGALGRRMRKDNVFRVWWNTGISHRDSEPQCHQRSRRIQAERISQEGQGRGGE